MAKPSAVGKNQAVDQTTSEDAADVVALPLSGVRVLDLAGEVGPYCGKLLADAGADVIKVEHPAGDAMRRKPPFARGVDPPESSLLFAYYNNNKRGITLDLARSDAEPIVRRLAETAGVVITSTDSRHPVVGLVDGAAGWPEWAPDSAIHCSITPFGRTGPLRDWRATPFTAFAFSGQMHHMGDVDGPPLAMPGRQLYDLTSARAATAVEALLLARTDRHRACVDLAVHDVGTWHKQVIERFSMAGRTTTRETSFSPPPSGVWECADGFVDIACHSPRHWDMFVELLGSPQDLLEPLYKDRNMRVQLFDLVGSLVGDHLRSQSAADLVDRGQAAGLPCALRYRPAEFLDDLQPAARGTLVTVEHAAIGRVTIPAAPTRSRPPIASYRRAAPLLGESNIDVYVDELGFAASEVDRWRSDGLI